MIGIQKFYLSINKIIKRTFMEKKYVTPEVEVIEVETENTFLTVSNPPIGGEGEWDQSLTMLITSNCHFQ